MLEVSKGVDLGSPFQEGVVTEDLEEICEVGGRLGRFATAWSHDRWAKNLVSRGLCWRWIRPPRIHHLSPQRTSEELWLYVKEMLEKGVVIPFEGKGVQNHLFSVPKRDSNKKRVILDLSRLNR